LRGDGEGSAHVVSVLTHSDVAGPLRHRDNNAALDQDPVEPVAGLVVGQRVGPCPVLRRNQDE